MKRGWIAFLLLVVILLVVFYFFGSASTVSQNILIEANQKTIYRCLTDKSLLQKWWKEDSATSATNNLQRAQVAYDNFSFAFAPRPFDVADVVVHDGDQSIQSFITVVPLLKDTCDVTWKAKLPTGGLFSRFANYSRAQKLKRSMASALQRLQQFVQSEKNVYGFPVAREQVTDSLLVVTKMQDTVKPTVETYYGLIKKLRDYIARAGAQETNYPMLNISKVDSTHYQTMVAIPVSKALPGAGDIVPKRMVPGNILVAEVHGGMSNVTNGMHQMEAYVIEHSFAQPGLPFQSMVTDRLTERDTSKWITKLYYPVQ